MNRKGTDMGYTALIVDDEPIIRMDLADQLGEVGIQVVAEAGDGFDAVDLARRHKPDVVLMDISMPVFDGLTAAGQIMEEGLAKTVILITSFCDNEYIERAKQIGVGGYLVKPIRSQSLLPAIEIAIAQSRRYEEAKQREEEARKQVEDQKVISRARSILIEKQGMTEKEAMSFLQQESMKKRVSLAGYARRIIAANADDEILLRAKKKLMKQYEISDRAAYKRIRSAAEEAGCSIREMAAKILE